MHAENITRVGVNAGDCLQDDVALIVGVCPVEGELLPVAGDIQTLDRQIGKLPLPVGDEGVGLRVQKVNLAVEGPRSDLDLARRSA